MPNPVSGAEAVTYRHIEHKRGDLILANPADPTDTLRFKARVSNSNAGPNTIVRAEIIENWRTEVTGCGPSASCPTGIFVPQAIRVYLSLDMSNRATSVKRIEHAIAILTAAKDDLVHGFVPDKEEFPICKL